ncbi:MAG TPA: hypothetical protein VF271_02290 [Rhodanobacteraceae bacterium]
MNPAEMAARGHCQRTRRQIDSDIQTACWNLHVLTLPFREAAVAGQECLIDRAEVRRMAEGLRQLLAEPAKDDAQ